MWIGNDRICRGNGTVIELKVFDNIPDIFSALKVNHPLRIISLYTPDPDEDRWRDITGSAISVYRVISHLEEKYNIGIVSGTDPHVIYKEDGKYCCVLFRGYKLYPDLVAPFMKEGLPMTQILEALSL